MYNAAKAFNAIGLTLDGTINGPSLRPPKDLSCSELCVRGLMSKEVTGMMRGLLRLHFSQEQIEGLSSHSAKSTCLSWCAKFGLSKADRSCLGRHTSAVVSSSAIYARDLVIGPVKQLEKVITEIAAGQFVPDASRSDYFKTPHDAGEVACSQAVKEQSFEADSAGPVEEIVQSSDDEQGSVSQLMIKPVMACNPMLEVMREMLHRPFASGQSLMLRNGLFTRSLASCTYARWMKLPIVKGADSLHVAAD